MNDREKSLQDLRTFLDSEDGKKFIDEMKTGEKREKKMKKYHLKRFHEKFSHRFEEIMDKLIAKYDSREYHNKCYSRGYEPDTPLYWFIFEYVSKNGRKATKKEYKKYGNMFTGTIRYYEGFYFHTMHGQGSVIHVIKEKESN